MAERMQTYFLNGIESIIRNEVDITLPGPSVTRNRLASVSSRSSFSGSISSNTSNTERSNSPTQQVDDDDAYLAACKKLNTNQFIDILRKILFNLTELLHSHFLCTQWHRDPFSSLNNDLKYLYRANRDQDESMMAHLPSTPLKQARKTAPNDIENKIV